MKYWLTWNRHRGCFWGIEKLCRSSEAQIRSNDFEFLLVNEILKHLSSEVCPAWSWGKQLPSWTVSWIRFEVSWIQEDLLGSLGPGPWRWIEWVLDLSTPWAGLKSGQQLQQQQVSWKIRVEILNLRARPQVPLRDGQAAEQVLKKYPPAPRGSFYPT